MGVSQHFAHVPFYRQEAGGLAPYLGTTAPIDQSDSSGSPTAHGIKTDLLCLSMAHGYLPCHSFQCAPRPPPSPRRGKGISGMVVTSP